MPDPWSTPIKTATYEATQEQLDAAAANPMGMMAAGFAEAMGPNGPVTRLFREAIDREWERLTSAKSA
jgi:hypothetical protein